MNESESSTTEKAEVGTALKQKWVTKKSTLSILTAGENVSQDFASKSGGKTRYWDKKHSGPGASHWAPHGTYLKVSESLDLSSKDHLMKQTYEMERPLWVGSSVAVIHSMAESNFSRYHKKLKVWT